MQKVIFVLKMLVLVLLVLWTLNAYTCIFLKQHSNSVDQFSVGLGLLIQLCAYYASYLFLFKLAPTMIYIRDTVSSQVGIRVTFLVFSWVGSWLAIAIVLAGVHAHGQDKLENSKINAVIWSQCVFTVTPCYKHL